MTSGENTATTLASRYQRVGELFLEALELNEEERLDFLARACLPDQALFDEVSSLLTAHSRYPDLLSPPFAITPSSHDDKEVFACAGCGSCFEIQTEQSVPRCRSCGNSLNKAFAGGIVIGDKYRVEKLLGQGGMGTVYRVRHLGLDRHFALKLISGTEQRGIGWVKLFEMEAKALGQLKHPNIVDVTDYGIDVRGISYLVTEILDGVTLNELQRPVSVYEALRIFNGIANAVDFIHSRGILHGDLKLNNVFVADVPKLIDFGLATIDQHEGEKSRGGTPLYMAPELISGGNPSKASEIYALGVMLYAMLTGKMPFQGTSDEVLQAHCQLRPPKPSAVRRDLPAELDTPILRMLSKNPGDRPKSAYEAMALVAIEGLSSSSAGASLPPEGVLDPDSGVSVTSTRRKRELLAWVAAGILLVAAASFAVLYFRPTTPSQNALERFTILLPENLRAGESRALSPDGTKLAFAGTDSGSKTQLWIRSLDALAPKALPGTEGARLPFWSPDSRSLGFFAEGKLKRIEIEGGIPRVLTSSSGEPRGASWGPGGNILFTPDTVSPLYQVAASGGEAAPLTKLDQSRNETSHRWPYFLPDGRHFIYFARGEKQNQAIYVSSAANDRKLLLSNVESNVAYIPPIQSLDTPGLLLFMRDLTLIAQPFDVEKLTLSGEPRTVAEDVAHFGEIGPTGLGGFTLSANGMLCYQTGNKSITQLTWYDRSGMRVGAVGPPGVYGELALTRDARRLAMDSNVRAEEGDIWLVELARGTFSRFTFDPRWDRRAIWSPDGSQIVFGSNRSGTDDMYLKSSNSVGAEKLLLHSAFTIVPDDWSPDGRLLLYEEGPTPQNTDLWIIPMKGGGKPYPIVQSRFNELHGRFSPDGRWVAYSSNETGADEVYVQSLTPSGGKWQISVAGGSQPQWSNDGKELFYLGADRSLMAVPVKIGNTFTFSKPNILFHTRTYPTTNDFVVSPDRQRFLINDAVESYSTDPISVVLNWASLLKR